MNIFIILLLIIAGIIALFLLIALVVKKEFTLKKEIIINKPGQQVFDYIRLIKNQEHYSVWVMRDPDINLVYTGTDGAVGFKSAWKSDDKNVGVGEQEIVHIKDGESIKVEIRFEKPFKATNWATTEVVNTAGGQTLVNQVFYGKSKFPMNIMNLFMDKLVGKDMQQNLQNLKNNLEN